MPGITMGSSYVLDYMDKKAPNGTVDPSQSHWGAQKAVADQYGLYLDQYEAGCHFITSVMMAGYPLRTPSYDRIADLFAEFQQQLQHSPELGEVYSDMYRRFIAIGGRYPAKYVESSSLPWGGIRYWVPTVDRDNPTWRAVKAGSRAYFAP